MASSTLTGERRSARRGGMIVLGKVAVPKPVNLPSQRMENHGLDPSVEIVPKGTLSWGSRSSSSVLNAWGTPASPTTDGSVGSPRHHNGRPSSGGSGTRPSTAGSDRCHEPGSNAWGPNSRPLSASGALASNQTSAVSSRPRSAETRPGSSQLSRFAEPTAENSVAWGRPGTAERLGSASSKVNAFTLSSGDFPTLGSEKNSESHIQQGHSSHGHPTSASGGAEAQKEMSETSPTEDGPVDASKEKGTVNTWKSSPYLGGGGPPPNMDHWQRDPQQAQSYTIPNMPPHHFDPWHGTLIRNPPEGVWYRGGPAGSPYGHAGPPGSYPLEPFGYYHSQGPLPARPVSASQAVPRPGGPGSYHPKNGDTFRPRMSDSYVVPSHPVMPVRPGVYPGPMPYDGYYGLPRMNFCNPNERDVPVMGMGGGPCVYNRYPNQNVHPDSGNFHVGPGGYGPSSGMSKEQVNSGHAHDTHGRPYKVLLKQHDSWGENDTEGKREHSVMTSGTRVEKGQQAETPGENYWEADERQDKQVDFSKSTSAAEVFQSKNSWEGHSSDPVVANLPANTCMIKPVDDSFIKKPETVADSVGSLQQFPAMKKNSTLINKIEGLNNKARNSDGRNEVGLVSSSEENTKGFGNMNVKTGHYTNEVGPSIAGSTEKASTGSPPSTTSNELMDASAGDKAHESSVTGRHLPRASEPQASATLDSSEAGEKAHSQIHKRGHEMQGRADYRGKGRFNIQDSEEWRKKPPGVDSLVSVNVSKSESSDTHLQDGDTSQEAPERQELNFQGKAGEKSCAATTLFDSCDYKSQRAKIKERAIQRAKQLQKEEEERTREQKAKALAKLEELNKRTLVENSAHNTENNAVQHKQEELHTDGAPKTSFGIGDLASGCELGKNSDAVTQTENSTNRLEEATTTNTPLEASSCTQDLLVVVDSSLPSLQNASASSGFAVQTTAPHIRGNGFSKHKQMGKRKQNISEDKNLVDKLVPREGTKVEGNVIVSENTFEVPTSQLKKKNGRSVRNKHKLDEFSQGTDLSPPPATDGRAVKVSPESGKGMSSESFLEAGSIHMEEKVDVQDFEEVHSRQDNQWKPQHPRRIFRSTQATKPSEKLHASEGVVIWAPVRLPNKSGWVEETGQNTLVEGNYSSDKNVHATSNNLKSKRAEMERYVPKPVAKELSQHENSQQASFPSLKQEIRDEMMVKVHNGSQVTKSSGADSADASRGGLASDTKNADSNKHNKHGKAHTSWRQLGAAESSTVVEGPHEGSSSDASKTVPKPVEQHQFSKADTYSPKVQEKYCDNWNNVSQVSTEAVAVPVDIKNHVVSGKGKRHPSKLHRGTGHYQNAGDNKLSEGEMAEKTDTQLPFYGSREEDGRSVPKTESQGTSEYAACQWQPKSQTYQTHGRQGNRGNGGQRVVVQQRTPEDFATQGTGRGPPQADKEGIGRVQSHFHLPENHKPNAAELINARHQETKKGAKYIDSSRVHPHFPNEGPPSAAELAPETAASEVTVSSGVRRHGQQQNGRFNRGQEAPYGGGRGPGHEINKQQVPANGDRQKHNSHYEYQPIGSYHKSNNTLYPNSAEGEERDNSRITGLKYRERGQNHSKRSGHFYGRNAGGSVAHVGTAAGNGE